MPTNLASNRGAGPRVPLGGVGDAANGVGTPRGFRGMKPSPMSVANSVKITPDDMQKVEHKDMLYLTKKPSTSRRCSSRIRSAMTCSTPSSRRAKIAPPHDSGRWRRRRACACAPAACSYTMNYFRYAARRG